MEKPLIISRKYPRISRNFWLLAVSSFCLLLAGCASLNKAECISANWFDLGFDNALSGKRASYVAEHTQACAKHAITPDIIVYKEGWQAGLTRFCTAQSGWGYGSKGGHYNNTCSAQTEQEFLPAYRLAKEIAHKRNQLAQLKSESHALFQSLRNETLSDNQHVNIISERFALSFEQLRIESAILQLQAQALDRGYL